MGTELIDIIKSVIAVLGTAGGFYFGMRSNRRAEDSEVSEDAKKDATLLVEIGYIKGGIDDIKKKQEDADKRYVEVVTRLATVEASAKQAHKRIDDHLTKIKGE
ncbi:MAG: hypothetical protein RSB78_04370 [Oscillospiraceae bacterium]